MGDRQQLETVDEERFLELIGHPKLQTPVSWPQVVTGNPDVLGRIGSVADALGLPVAHLARAEKIGHELEPFPVPGKEEWTRRGFAVELFDDQRGGTGLGFRSDRGWFWNG